MLAYMRQKNLELDHAQNAGFSWAPWYTPVIPAAVEAEAGGSLV